MLAEDGLLAQHIEGFKYRPQQHEMAIAVNAAFETGEVLIAEAGTGTGKTFAYLVPALLSGLKVIISTGTRNLQDQLFLRDLPRVKEALSSPLRIALLKGRGNYLCIHRLENAMLDPRGHRRETIAQLTRVREWSNRTKRGDIAELVDIAEDALVWPLVTSTTDNCLGQDCPSWNQCHLVEARRHAQEADIVVINHYLLCADFVLKDEGFGELLPSADAYIIDEAHQLPEVASNFFGQSISSRQLLELVTDTRNEYLHEAGDISQIEEQLDQLSKTTRDLRLAFGTQIRRGGWREIESSAEIQQGLETLQTALSELKGMLDMIKGRGKGLDTCLERLEAIQAGLTSLFQSEEDGNIRWFETFRQSLRLNSTPLDIADIFQAQMTKNQTCWIFTSATLAVGEDFSFFQKQLGLTDAKTAQWDSPFDYQTQALWYVPRDMPSPKESGYTQAVMTLALPLIEASKGRTFLLFTSHRALQAAADWLDNRVDLPLLVQGDAPKAELLDQFVAHGNAVLMGTSSFWEGVDVRGEALSLVIIDKLPFASPGDPVMQARLDAIKKSGSNPFMDYQVPQAAIALKQGAGRLIRDVDDRGVLVVCDPRLLRSHYGQSFLDALPAFSRTRDSSDVIQFFSD